MKYNKLQNKGFSLIELMVSIAIIAILTALIIVNIASSRAKARDAKRISDIAQIQLALEQYFTKNGFYPKSVDNYVNDIYSEYISTQPKDPLSNSTADYVYAPDPDRNYYDYILKIRLENPYKEGLVGNLLGYNCDPEVYVENEKGYIYCVSSK